MSLTFGTSINSVGAAVGAGDRPTAAYIHIPFCRRRCYYCDFPVSIVGDRPPLSSRSSQPEHQSFGAIAQYIEALTQEIAVTPPLGAALHTIFFGGGTPSLLSVAQLQQILAAIDQRFGIATEAEISMEIDPGTFDLAQLQGYKAAGVNRVSLGVQAFQPELLQACGRTHTPADIQTAVDWIRQVDLPNFSLDLISGLPHQTLEHWQASLQAAVSLEPAHLSVYDLTVEPMTAFSRQYQPGVQPLPSEDTTANQYRLAQRQLTAAGYTHYEISNYARPGFQCRHNRVYWENRSYYGFGMGAASYIQGQRFTRPRTRQAYFEWVQALSAQGGQIDCPVTSPTEQLLDTLMLGLRLAEGIRVQDLIRQFGIGCWSQVQATLRPYQRQGWVEFFHTEPLALDRLALDGEAAIEPDLNLDLDLDLNLDSLRFRLSDPEGFLFSNVVLAALFEQLEV